MIYQVDMIPEPTQPAPPPDVKPLPDSSAEAIGDAFLPKAVPLPASSQES